MKKISFQIMREETYDVITESGVEQKTRQVLEPMVFTCSSSLLDQNVALVSSIAYNGEYTIEDDGEPEPSAEPTTEQRVSDLEEQLVQADETAIALYEAQEEQEAINAQQDEALMEIYEMIG